MYNTYSRKRGWDRETSLASDKAVAHRRKEILRGERLLKKKEADNIVSRGKAKTRTFLAIRATP